MRLMSIASGSSGNCIYMGEGDTHVLIDDGLSCKKVCEGLSEIGLSGKDISAILVTHEHADHIGGLGVFLRKFKTPVYATAGTIEGIRNYKSEGKLPEGVFHAIRPEETFEIGALSVNPLSISHDANEPCAYRVNGEKASAAVITDLGVYNYHLLDALQGLDGMVLEANHDLRMLEVGPYPYYLKRRIAGDKGHLSNEASAHMLDDLIHEGLRNVFLGHLSKENNMPPLALETVRMEVELSPSRWTTGQFNLSVAPRDHVSELVHL